MRLHCTYGSTHAKPDGVTAVAPLPDTDREWLLRPYDEARDLDGMLYFLGVSYTRSRAGIRDGANTVGRPWQSETVWASTQEDFVSRHKPVWHWLLRNAEVTLAVDREHPDTDIWGWLVTSGPTVIHALGAKRSAIKAGIANEIVADLCGARWEQPQTVTLELPQFRTKNVRFNGGDLIRLPKPQEWVQDPSWLVTRMLARPA